MQLPPLNLALPIPLFPLPNCVLYPGVVQPLHIFEPRYRDMMDDTLDDQRAIAIALLKPGWEKNYYGNPPLYPVLCVGRIVAHERLPDGKFNLLLHGTTRARLLTEHKRNLYRVAMLEPLPDTPIDPSHATAEAMQRTVLHELFTRTPLGSLTVAPTLLSLFDDNLPLGRLVDALAFGLVQDIPTKQLLLEEPDPLKRAELLLRDLVSLAAKLPPTTTPVPAATSPASWPPSASNN